jgi:hypothetical protein
MSERITDLERRLAERGEGDPPGRKVSELRPKRGRSSAGG